MQPTQFETLSIVPFTAVNPTVLGRAIGVPMRVLVRNVGGVLLFLGSSPNDVSNPQGPTTQTYRLPTGETDIFVLAPGQVLYASGFGGATIASVSLSEALPVDMKP